MYYFFVCIFSFRNFVRFLLATKVAPQHAAVRWIIEKDCPNTNNVIVENVDLAHQMAAVQLIASPEYPQYSAVSRRRAR